MTTCNETALKMNFVHTVHLGIELKYFCLLFSGKKIIVLMDKKEINKQKTTEDR